MKLRLLLLLPLLAVQATAACAEPCNTTASQFVIAETLRRASETRPVDFVFNTAADGVGMAKHLRERYPEKMSLILQYEFSRLKVMDDREVQLLFSRKPEKLMVPFAAIKTLWDNGEVKCSEN